MKKWLIIGAIAVLVAAVVWAFARRSGGESTNYRFTLATRGDLTRLVNATGTLEAVTTVQVGSQISGTIYALYADFNDNVRQGQLLALLDTTFLSAQVAEAQANVAKAQAANAEANRNIRRADSLLSRSVISRADYDQATTANETAQASLEGALAALSRARTNLAYARIASPISGIVVSRNVDVGQTVAASLSAPTIFTIAQDLKRMRLLAAVDEADIGQLEVGNPVMFTVDAFPDMLFHGEVEQIRLAPTVQQNVVTYTIVIGVDNRIGKLLPGMTATVAIEVGHRTDILKVPASATRFRPQQERTSTATTDRAASSRGGKRQVTVDDSRGSATVYLLKAGKQLEKRTIRVGLSTSSELEVLEGLSEGDSVIVGTSQGEGNQRTGGTNPLNPMSRPPSRGLR